METAKKDMFCHNVPDMEDTEKAMRWVAKVCSNENLGNDRCLKYMHKFIHICTEQAKRKKLSLSEYFMDGIKKGQQKKFQ